MQEPVDLGLIPARGGSKGVPRKNLRLLGGRPLIEYTVAAALASRRLTDLVVSTEDAEIAGLCRRLGANVPFMRPPELATDSSDVASVVRHAVEFYERCIAPVRTIAVLYATSPFRTAEHIDEAYRILEETGAPQVLTVTALSHDHPGWALRIGEDGRARRWDPGVRAYRRQDLPPAYAPNGAIYLLRREALDSLDELLQCPGAVVMPLEPPATVNVDTPLDFVLAEALIERGYVHFPPDPFPSPSGVGRVAAGSRLG